MSLFAELREKIDDVRLLEEENERLRKSIDTLTEQLEAQQTAPYVEHLLDLLQTDIEAKEKCILNDSRLIELIATYRQIRPK